MAIESFFKLKFGFLFFLWSFTWLPQFFQMWEFGNSMVF